MVHVLRRYVYRQGFEVCSLVVADLSPYKTINRVILGRFNRVTCLILVKNIKPLESRVVNEPLRFYNKRHCNFISCLVLHQSYGSETQVVEGADRLLQRNIRPGE